MLSSQYISDLNRPIVGFVAQVHKAGSVAKNVLYKRKCHFAGGLCLFYFLVSSEQSLPMLLNPLYAYFITFVFCHYTPAQ